MSTSTSSRRIGADYSLLYGLAPDWVEEAMAEAFDTVDDAARNIATNAEALAEGVKLGLAERRIVVPSGFVARLAAAVLDNSGDYYDAFADGLATAAEDSVDFLISVSKLFVDETARAETLSKLRELGALLTGPAEDVRELGRAIALGFAKQINGFLHERRPVELARAYGRLIGQVAWDAILSALTAGAYGVASKGGRTVSQALTRAMKAKRAARDRPRRRKAAPGRDGDRAPGQRRTQGEAADARVKADRLNARVGALVRVLGANAPDLDLLVGFYTRYDKLSVDPATIKEAQKLLRATRRASDSGHGLSPDKPPGLAVHRRAASGELRLLDQLHADPVLKRLQGDSGVREIEIQMLQPSSGPGARTPDFLITAKGDGGSIHIEVKSTTGSKFGHPDPVRREPRPPRPTYSAKNVVGSIRKAIRRGQISADRPGVIFQFVVPHATPPFMSARQLANLEELLAKHPHVHEVVLCVNNRNYRVGSRKSRLDLAETEVPTGSP